MDSQLHEAYEAKFNKKVSARYKNDDERIKSKLENIEEAVQQLENDTNSLDEIERAKIQDISNDLDRMVQTNESELSIEKPEPTKPGITAPAPRVATTKNVDNFETISTVNNNLINSRDSYDRIQAWYGFTKQEAFIGDLARYGLNPKELQVVGEYVQNKTKLGVLSNLNMAMFPDWVKPIVERHGLTTNDILSADTLDKKIYDSYLNQARQVKDANIDIKQQADIQAMAKGEADNIRNYIKMLQNDLKRKQK